MMFQDLASYRKLGNRLDCGQSKWARQGNGSIARRLREMMVAHHARRAGGRAIKA
jgi:hypothetical protein